MNIDNDRNIVELIDFLDGLFKDYRVEKSVERINGIDGNWETGYDKYYYYRAYYNDTLSMNILKRLIRKKDHYRKLNIELSFYHDIKCQDSKRIDIFINYKRFM